MLCDGLAGWDGGALVGDVEKEGIYVYLWLIHAVVWQKSTQHCKAIFLQLKINFKKLCLKNKNQTNQNQLLHDSAIPFMGTYPEKNTCTPMFTAALFKIAKT